MSVNNWQFKFGSGRPGSVRFKSRGGLFGDEGGGGIATISRPELSTTEPRDLNVCRHEAAHGVVFHSMGFQISEILCTGNEAHCCVDIANESQSAGTTMRYLVGVLAGRVADCGRGRDLVERCGADSDLADALIRRLTGEKFPSTNELRRNAENLAHVVLRDHPHAHHALTAALFERGRLGSEEVWRLCEDNFCTFGNYVDVVASRLM